MRTSTRIDARGVTISRDGLSDEIEAYDVDMLRPW
jgi:hypothetical protein